MTQPSGRRWNLTLNPVLLSPTLCSGLVDGCLVEDSDASVAWTLEEKGVGWGWLQLIWLLPGPTLESPPSFS